MASVPHLNLLARPALLGFTYRALAGMADAEEAPLTLRRVEQLQAQLTMLTQRQSQLKSGTEIAGGHASTARKAATQAQLDLRIFKESYEPPARGLFRRLTPQQQAEQRKLRALEAIAEHETDKAEELAKRRDQLSAELVEVDAQLKAARATREELLADFEAQLAAHVLGLVSIGRMDEARDVLETARRDVRGSILVGALLVLTDLFSSDVLNPAAARRTLDSLEPLFSQLPDSSPRTLALLLRLAEGAHITQSDLGLLAEGNFRSAGMYRLYQLVLVLAGAGVDPQEHGPWAGTLRLLAPEHRSPDLQADPAVRAPDLLAAFDSEDQIRVTLAAAGLLATGALERVWETVWADELPERGSLIEHLSDPEQFPAWPLGLVTPWAAALSCFALLALYMAEGGRGGRFGRWLEDSYGWPKDDLYWWTLATLNNDAALLKNIRGGADQLFTMTDSRIQTN